MDAFYALLGIVVLAVAFGLVVARIEGLALFAPGNTRALSASARKFCRHGCRTSAGRCPLTGELEPTEEECPLWRYVGASLPTSVHGSPFESSRLSIPSP